MKHEQAVIKFMGKRTVKRKEILNSICIDNSALGNVMHKLIKQNKVQVVPNLFDMRSVSYRLRRFK